jgi:hypothetical protein
MKSLIITFILLFLPLSVFSQSDYKKTDVSDFKAILNLGIGTGTFDIHYTTSLQIGYKSHSIMMRATKCLETSTGKLLNYSPTPQLEATEISLLYGYGITIPSENSATIMQLHAGFGKMTGVTRGELKEYGSGYGFEGMEYEPINHSKLGFAFNVEIIQAFLPYAGCGIKLYGNHNNDLPIYGAAFIISVGKLY